MHLYRLLFALLVSNCLCAVPFQLIQHTETFDRSDYKSFKTWILSQHPSSAKKALLNATIASNYYPFSPTVAWYKAKMSAADFEASLLQTYPSATALSSSVQGNYDYVPNNAFWVDFANAHHFGGGFRSSGNVQEERMFDEFPSLPNLAYVLRDSKTILPVTSGDVPEPFLVASLSRRWDVSKVPYGKKLDSTSPEEVRDSVITPPKPYAVAHIIGLAALDYSKGGSQSRYSMEDLKYHVQAALLGDLAARQYNGSSQVIIHTGKWGSGAFKNSVKMLTALQILAAEMAFNGLSPAPQLVFHGIEASLINPIQTEIVERLAQGETPSYIITLLHGRQKTDPSWQPQT